MHTTPATARKILGLVSAVSIFAQYFDVKTLLTQLNDLTERDLLIQRRSSFVDGEERFKNHVKQIAEKLDNINTTQILFESHKQELVNQCRSIVSLYEKMQKDRCFSPKRLGKTAKKVETITTNGER